MVRVAGHAAELTPLEYGLDYKLSVLSALTISGCADQLGPFSGYRDANVAVYRSPTNSTTTASSSTS